MTCTRRSICIAASIAHFALTHNALLAQSLFMALRPPGSATFRPAATSGDGRVVVGTGGPGAGYRWTQEEGFTPLPLMPGDNSGWVNGLSSDGQVAVGVSG